MKTNIQEFSSLKKSVLTIAIIVWLINISLLIFSLVYASPDSDLRRHSLIIGLLFIGVTSLVKGVYNSQKL